MSYILNALRKSEQERLARQPETVTDRLLAQQPGKSRKTAKWIGAAILCNVLIGGGFIWYAQKTLVPSAAHQSSNPQTNATVAVKPEDKPINTMKRASEQTATSPVPASASAAQVIAANKPTARQPQSPSLIAKPDAAIKLTASPKVKKSAIEKEEKPISLAGQAEKTMPLLVQSKEKTPGTTPVPDNRIPYFYELPYEFRQSVPKMTINVFVYSSEPSERFVMINMAKYKAGQQTKDAVEIKDIRPQSLVVSYQNQLFQIERP